MSHCSYLFKTGRKVLFLLFFSFISFYLAGQSVTVKGKIIDTDQNPVIGATVTIKGKDVGSVTDLDGNYSLQASVGDVLVASSVGYTTQEVTLSQGVSELNFEMKSGLALDEVVVVGFGTQKKVDVTGAVARVNIEALQGAPNTNIAQFMQGAVPGLNVGVATVAGGTPPIAIRGRTTLSGNQNVLIILDGVQYNQSLASINPDDIASIDILKDASSTAVYGAQAANGVILITSRRGNANRPPRISFNTAYTFQNPTVGDEMKPYNREQFLNGVTEGFWDRSYVGPEFKTRNPNFDVKTVVDATMANANRSELLPNDYNWAEEATNPGSIFENTLSISGGTDKYNYLLSAGLVDQKGFIVNDIFKRQNLRANLEVSPKDWIKFGLISTGSFTNQDGAEPSFGVMNITSPLLVPFDTNGNIIPNPSNTVVPNPFNTFYVDDKERNQYLFANAYTEISFPFLKGLTYRLNFGNNGRFRQRYTSSQFDGNLTGRISKNDQTYYDYTLDNILTYTKKFGDHDITGTLLYGAVERTFNETFVEGVGFARLNLSYNDIGNASVRNARSFSSREALAYQMARVNYKFMDRYLLTATVRQDGFSGFAKNSKSAIFPSFSVGWILSEEQFIKNIEAINLLKLRVGYGVAGNQTPPFSSQALVGLNEAYIFGNGGSTAFGQQVNSLGNDNLRWERTLGTNIGADFELFNSRLTGSFEYYINNTKDLLFRVPLPNLTGFNDIQTNVGQLNNNGIETTISYGIFRSKNLSWNSTFNFWSNNNKIVALSGADNNKDGVEDDVISTGTGGLYIGRSINTIFDHQQNGIYQIGQERLPGFQLGTLAVVDQNADGKIDAADRTFLGTLEPKYRMSWINTINYKQFNLMVFLNSIQGGKNGYFGNNTREYFREDNSIRNNDLVGVDYWSPANPNGKYPRNIAGTHSTVRPQIYEQRNFVRLQDVTLGYNFSPSVLSKIKAQAINVYVSGKNLATFTKWQGWDPETGQGMITDGRPVLRGVTIGAMINY